MHVSCRLAAEEVVRYGTWVRRATGLRGHGSEGSGSEGHGSEGSRGLGPGSEGLGPGRLVPELSETGPPGQLVQILPEMTILGQK